MSVNAEGALWSLSEMKYVRRFNTLVQTMLPELNAPERFYAKWAAAEITFVAQKSPLHRKCLKDRHPSANSNIDDAPILFAEYKVIKTRYLFRIFEAVEKRYFYARTMEIFLTQLICLKTKLKNWVKSSCIINVLQNKYF